MRSALLVVVGLALAGCTDWQAGSGATGDPVLQQAGPGAGGVSDATSLADAATPADVGLTTWETWTSPPPADAGPTDSAAAADVAAGPDAPAGTDTAGADTAGTDTAGTDTAGADTAGELPDGGDATGPDDAGTTGDSATPADDVPDAGPADAGVPDGAAAGKDATYTFDGKGDFVGTDVNFAKDAGVFPVDVGPIADGGLDAGGMPDVGPDGGTVVDIGTSDAVADAGVTDTSGPDTTGPDGGAVVDIGTSDAVADASVTDASGPDTIGPDVGLDSVSPDFGGAEVSQPDVSAPVDWQGYPDANLGPEAYQGAIASCLELYLYQQETCGKDSPSVACIQAVGEEASGYAKFLFEPLRQCEVQVCAPKCAGSTDNQCMDQCIGKYCAAQFFACTSNNTSKTQDCAWTWQCMQQYEEKFLTISSKCYANASPVAQQQFAAVVGCVTPPQTATCIPQIATCFGATPTSTASCYDTLQCTQKCSDEACGFLCLGKASPAAVGMVDAIWACSMQKCAPKCAGDPDPACGDKCLQASCAPELLTCLSDQ